jgi:hypothetical protein
MLYNSMNKSTYLKITSKLRMAMVVTREMQNRSVKTMAIMSEGLINR